MSIKGYKGYDINGIYILCLNGEPIHWSGKPIIGSLKDSDMAGNFLKTRIGTLVETLGFLIFKKNKTPSEAREIVKALSSDEDEINDAFWVMGWFSEADELADDWYSFLEDNGVPFIEEVLSLKARRYTDEDGRRCIDFAPIGGVA